MAARFSIGVDLGTTNSALAYVPLTGDAQPEVLAVSQWESETALVEAPTLPSFLYLPEDGRDAELPGRVAETDGWIAGRLARRKASETPGRVVRSAKSWLCHHSADRSAPILPWGSEDLAPAQKISPVRAAAFILNYLRGAWDSRFAESGFAFDAQEITITVPASFDAAALWQLRDAGFCFPGKRSKVQECILWRRVAGGLAAERQERLLMGELATIRAGKASPELVRLAGSLERLPRETKVDLIEIFIVQALARVEAKQHCAPYLAALGLLLNRTPLYAGPETVVAAEFVVRAYAAFQDFDWAEPKLMECCSLFLRLSLIHI